MENIYDVTMGVRKKTSLPLPWEPKVFRVFGKGIESAKAAALIQAAKAYPINEAWEYDHQNATVEEISQEQIDAIIEERRSQVQEEGDANLNEMLDELKKHGIDLPGFKLKK